MSNTALFIKHKALPGKRDEVRRVWEKHLRARVSENGAHEAYFYCYDDNDPDTICVFQLYRDSSGPREFVGAAWYPAYETEVSPLLAESEFRSATPLWIKGAAGQASCRVVVAIKESTTIDNPKLIERLGHIQVRI